MLNGDISKPRILKRKEFDNRQFRPPITALRLRLNVLLGLENIGAK